MSILDNDLNISVVVVTFNRAEMLKEILSSLAEQIRCPDEVIIVDNNSTDNTKEIVDSFRGSINIIYVLERGVSIASARNAGVKMASGDIVAFTDDDCVADKEWLYYLEMNFLRDPSIGMVGGEILPYKIQGNIIEEYCTDDALMRMEFSSEKEGPR